MTVDYLIAPGGRLSGNLRVPGDKSISHRAIMLGSLADGVTEIDGFLEGEDAIATIEALRALGIRIDGPNQGRVRIEGVGLDGLKPPRATLDCGNSGTSMRLLCGLLAAQPFASELTGDASLRQRPMRRVAQPLREMGADIRTADNGCPPLAIHPVAALHGIRYRLPVASAQVKSALLFAGLYAKGVTCITEPAPTRDHTERMLQAFAYPTERQRNSICISGGGRLSAAAIGIPADISSAAFFMVGASIAAGSDLVLHDVGINPTRTGVIEILRLMGATIELMNRPDAGAEPVADIRVRHAELRGIAIPPHLVPLAIDEFPALFIAAANAHGETVLTGAEELRVKESDRIQAMADGLRTLGVAVEATADGMRIIGGAYRGGEVGSRGDHRIAMAFAIAGLRATEKIVVRDCASVATSFPGFVDMAKRAGLRIDAARHGGGGQTRVPVIAIDGPSASGKGAVAWQVAQQIGFHYLDSGALYRLVALRAAQRGVPLDDENALAALAAGLNPRFVQREIFLDDESVGDAIRAEAVAAGASSVAALPAVRAALLSRQRDFQRAPGLVAEGRDMGSIVFPDAELKIFLTASAAERAARRVKQLKEKGMHASLPDILRDIQQRDARDSERRVAPLQMCADACLLDTTALTIDAAAAEVVWRYRQSLSRGVPLS